MWKEGGVVGECGKREGVVGECGKREGVVGERKIKMHRNCGETLLAKAVDS